MSYSGLLCIILLCSSSILDLKLLGVYVSYSIARREEGNSQKLSLNFVKQPCHSKYHGTHFYFVYAEA